MYLLLLAENGIMGLGMRLGFFVILASLYMRFSTNFMSLREGSVVSGDGATHVLDVYVLRSCFASVIGFLVNIISFDGLQFPLNRIHFWIMIGLSLAHLKVVYLKRNLDSKGEASGS